ncbi:MAG: hypothetical protein IT308_10845, partial [Anaerolineaceae bacterium]|nr:hypothetical protein [Anaerolineaceae bacterium]
MKEKGPLIIILTVLALCCCGVLVFSGILFGFSWLGFRTAEETGSDTAATPGIALATPAFGQLETPPVYFWDETLSPGATETLETLKNSLVPINDLRDLALRLENKRDIPETMPKPPRVYAIGDQEQFWVTNTDTNQNFQVTAVLQYITPHVYFWVEKDVTVKARDVKNLVETFENVTYPKNREFFGSEWTPGIDNDPHLYILYSRGGGAVGGYFSAVDSVHPLA